MLIRCGMHELNKKPFDKVASRSAYLGSYLIPDLVALRILWEYGIVGPGSSETAQKAVFSTVVFWGFGHLLRRRIVKEGLSHGFSPNPWINENKNPPRSLPPGQGGGA